MKGKRQNLIIILLFLALIFGMTAASLIRPVREFSERENRALAQMPKWSAASYFSGEFAQDYESFITDQFVFRDGWIGMKTAVERAGWKQESNGVYFAKDGYLIEKHEGSFDTPQAKSNLSHLADFMEKVKEQYGERHGTAVLVPNAVELLGEKLPPFAVRHPEEEYLQEAARMIPEGMYFDSKAVLEEHTGEQLYYRTDHHWTTAAAFYVYEAWAKKQGLTPRAKQEYQIETVTEDFRGTVEAKVGGDVGADAIQIYRPKEEYAYSLCYNRKETKDDLYDWEKLSGKDKYALFFGGNQPLIEADIENGSARRLLVIKDSYAHCFLPFAFGDFSEVDFVDLRYFHESLREYMEQGDYTDILFLYNASGFAEDANVAKLNH